MSNPQVDTTSARSAESETRQTTEKTATLLLLLLKQWKLHAPPDIQAKIGPNPEVSVRVGEDQVYKGLADSPAIKAIPEKDIDYLRFATGLDQGFSHSELTRDVEIRIGGHKVFEVAGGKVLRNQIGPEQDRKISIDIPGVTSGSTGAQQAQPEAERSSDTKLQVDSGEQERAARVKANPTPPARRNVVSNEFGVPATIREQQPEPPQVFEVPPAPVREVPQPEAVQEVSQSEPVQAESVQAEPIQPSVQSQPSLSIARSDIEQVAAGGNRSLAMTMGRYLAVREELNADKVRVSQPGFEYLQPKIDKAQRILPEVQSRLVEAMRDAGIEPRFESQGLDEVSQDLPQPAQEVSHPAPVEHSVNSNLDFLLNPNEQSASTPAEPTHEIVQGVSLDDPDVSVDLGPAPEPGSKEDVLDAALYIANQLGDRDGSGQRSYESAHFKIEAYGEELQVWDGDGRKVIDIDPVSGDETYRPSPEFADTLISAANELEQREKELEAEKEQEIDDGFEFGDD